VVKDKLNQKEATRPRKDKLNQKEVASSLARLASGTGLMLIATAFTIVVGFCVRIIVVRNLSQVDYGIFSISAVIFSIVTAVAAFGLPTAVTRYIARYRGKKDAKQVKGAIISGLQLSIAAGIVGGASLFLTSGLFARLFGIPELALLLKIWGVAIPFFITTGALLACFCGFGEVKPQVYQTFLFKTLEIAAVVALVFFVAATSMNVVIAYSLAYVLTSIAVIVYSYKALGKLAGKAKTVLFRKKMVFFALPLAILSIMGLVMAWTDMFMLGLFLPPAKVGLYNGAVPLAKYLPMVLGAAAFLYLPISSYLIGQNKLADLKRVYQVITKWIFAATLPLFCILVFFPGAVLTLLFGAEYAGAAMALRILSLGFFLHVAMGLNAETLVALGKQKTVFYCHAAAAVVNIGLNLLLIPVLGITGAAVATCSTYVVMNATISAALYKHTKIHPFTRHYVKPLIASTLIALGFYFAAGRLLTIEYWMLPVLLLLFLVAYGAALLITRSFDKEDLQMLELIKKKTGLKLNVISNIIKRHM